MTLPLSTSPRHSETSFTVGVVPPFNLLRTVAILRRRPSSLTDIVSGECYIRALPASLSPAPLLVRQINPTTLEIDIPGQTLDGAARQHIVDTLEKTLDLSFEMTALRGAVERVGVLSELAQHVDGMKPPRFESLWTALLSVVPFQLVSLDAGIAVLNRVITLCGTRVDSELADVYQFPSPHEFLATTESELRTCGLSYAKIRTLRSAAEELCTRHLTDDMVESLDDEAAIRLLTKMPGIGRWSAQVILLRGFRRLGQYPAGDSGATRTLNLYLRSQGLPASSAEAILADMGEWRGYLYYLLLAWRLRASGNLGESTAIVSGKLDDGLRSGAEG